MMEYGGFIFIVDEKERAELIEEYIDRDNSFTDTISSPDWKAKQSEIFLISLDSDNIQYIALCKRGNRVATQKYQIRLTNIHRFNEPIPLSDIESRVNARFQRYLLHSSNGNGSRIPPKSWAAMIKVIMQLRPTSNSEINIIEKLRKGYPNLSKHPNADVIVEERDAVNLALRIAGFDHKEILNWDASEDVPAPFLQGLQHSVLLEDQMIHHDSLVFGDWNQLARYQVGATTYRKNNERLTIMNVNRHKIEHTLGVDLLYYFEKYNSYTLIQYKRLLGDSSEEEFNYRFNDTSYDLEIQRMLDFENNYPTSQNYSSIFDYRLNSSAFYFKFCPSLTFTPASSEMVKGMYIPLQYLLQFTNSEYSKGPRGGTSISYKNIDRYLNNSLFIELVQNGWIGSRIAQSDALTRIVKESLDAGRSLILAAKQSAM